MTTTKKLDRVPDLLKKVELRWQPPAAVEGLGLLEQGMVAVLRRHFNQDRSESGYARLRKAYDDWNEARVAQVQELAGHLKVKGAKRGREQLRDYLPAAESLKTYLQEVFQKTHGLELEFLREDLVAAGKILSQMPFLGMSTGTYLLWLAYPDDLPVHTGLVRVLDRLGLISRTQSIKKARAQIEPIVPKGRTLEFLAIFAEVSDRWCDARKPICQECPLKDDCPHGKKTFAEWQGQQARLQTQRKRDEARRLDQVKKDDQRRQREAERQRKKLEAQGKRTERERELRARAEARERERKAKIAAHDKKAAAARDKQRKEKERLAAAKKKAAARKQASKKKAPAKKTVARKKPTRSARPANKKPAGKAAKAKPGKSSEVAKVAKKNAVKGATVKRSSKKAVPAKKVAKKATKKATKKKKR